MSPQDEQYKDPAPDYSFLNQQPAQPVQKKPNKKLVLLAGLSVFCVIIALLLVFVPSKKQTPLVSNQGDRVAVVRQLLADAKVANTRQVYDAFAPAYQPKEEDIDRTMIKPIANVDISNCVYEESSIGKTESQQIVLASCPILKTKNKVKLSATTVRMNGAVKVIAVGATGVGK